jgi:hypothetical protein
MIKYRLRCVRGHEFETWFASSAAYDKLAKRQQLTCATCGSDRVEKAIMAPRVAKGGRAGSQARQTDAQDEALAQEKFSEGSLDQQKALRAAWMALRQKVVETSEYVGPRFADEARKIHDEDAPERSIYGEATLEDVRDLLEDGISILPLPPASDKQN